LILALVMKREISLVVKRGGEVFGDLVDYLPEIQISFSDGDSR
jgi:hypothetical protein